nr:hypothetical protein [Tanacetum cinerariifolium]
ETTSQLDVPTPTSVAPFPITTPIMTSSAIATTTTTSQTPILPTTISSNIIQNLLSFGLLFRFNDRLRSLEQNFSEVMQTNQFAEVVRDDYKDDDEEGEDDEQESNEETREEESFDPIPQTPEDSEDEGDGEEDLGLNIGKEERHDEEEEEDELYRDVNINQ